MHNGRAKNNHIYIMHSCLPVFYSNAILYTYTIKYVKSSGFFLENSLSIMLFLMLLHTHICMHMNSIIMWIFATLCLFSESCIQIPIVHFQLTYAHITCLTTLTVHHPSANTITIFYSPPGTNQRIRLS